MLICQSFIWTDVFVCFEIYVTPFVVSKQLCSIYLSKCQMSSGPWIPMLSILRNRTVFQNILRWRWEQKVVTCVSDPKACKALSYTVRRNAHWIYVCYFVCCKNFIHWCFMPLLASGSLWPLDAHGCLLLFQAETVFLGLESR